MRVYGPELLHPVWDFLDGMIRDYGDILFMLFTYAAIPFLVWVLCGGLRRKVLAGKGAPDISPLTAIYLPLAPPRPRPEPLPPLIGQDCGPPGCDHEGDCHWD